MQVSQTLQVTVTVLNNQTLQPLMIDEIIFNIFKSLDVPELEIVSCVSRSWKAISEAVWLAAGEWLNLPRSLAHPSVKMAIKAHMMKLKQRMTNCLNDKNSAGMPFYMKLIFNKNLIQEGDLLLAKDSLWHLDKMQNFCQSRDTLFMWRHLSEQSESLCCLDSVPDFRALTSINAVIEKASECSQFFEEHKAEFLKIARMMPLCNIANTYIETLPVEIKKLPITFFDDPMPELAPLVEICKIA